MINNDAKLWNEERLTSKLKPKSSQDMEHNFAWKDFQLVLFFSLNIKHFPKFLYFALACGDRLPNPSLLHEGDLETQPRSSKVSDHYAVIIITKIKVNAKFLGGGKQRVFLAVVEPA